MTHPLDQSSARLVLLCLARSVRCALPLEQTVETMRPLLITPIAGTPPFVLGLAVVRGEAIPAVDVGALLGTDAPRDTSRFVIVKAKDKRIALAFEQVIGVRELPAGALAALPPLLGEPAGGTLAGVGALDEDLLVVLESARIVPDAAWQAIEKEGSR